MYCRRRHAGDSEVSCYALGRGYTRSNKSICRSEIISRHPSGQRPDKSPPWRLPQKARFYCRRRHAGDSSITCHTCGRGYTRSNKSSVGASSSRDTRASLDSASRLQGRLSQGVPLHCRSLPCRRFVTQRSCSFRLYPLQQIHCRSEFISRHPSRQRSDKSPPWRLPQALCLHCRRRHAGDREITSHICGRGYTRSNTSRNNCQTKPTPYSATTDAAHFPSSVRSS